MQELTTLPVLLTLLGLVALGQLFGPRGTTPPFCRRFELRWIWGAGIGFAVLSTWMFSGLYITGFACAPDFFEYCQALLFVNGEHDVFPEKRSRFAALLPAWIARDAGILDGLALAGVVCTGITGGALFYWARRLGGRCAGIFCIALSLSMAPLAALPRFLAFYPEICASLCLAAAATTQAILEPKRSTVLLAGTAIGISLLTDLRALLWALPFLGGCALGILWGKRSRQEVGWLFGALLLPLFVSYLLGSLAYGPDAISLETQMDIRPLFYQHGTTAPAFLPPHEIDSAYIWGRSNPLDLPATLGFIWEQKLLEGSVESPLPAMEHRVRAHHDAWATVLAVGAILTLLTLIRRPRRLLALGVSVLPFCLFFRAIGGMAEATPRFYTLALPGIAVLVSVGIGEGIRRLPRFRVRSLDPTFRLILFGGTVMALVLGWIPSWMASDAAWRTPTDCWDRPLDRISEFHGADPAIGRPQVACADAIHGDDPTDVLPLRTFNGP